jgi:predicted ATPase
MESNGLLELGKAILTEFSIFGLFAERDVCIPFESPVKILVSENGAGKTTILNTMYAVLNGNYQKLKSHEFERIRLSFSSGDVAEIGKEDLLPQKGHADFAQLAFFFDHIYDERGWTSGQMSREFRPDISRRDLELFGKLEEVFQREHIYQLFARAHRMSSSSHQTGATFRTTAKAIGASEDELIQLLSNRTLHNYIRRYRTKRSPKIELAEQMIQKNFPFEKLYFPTYRRIEEDLKTLGYSGTELSGEQKLIQFGMTDVEKRLERLTSEIKNSSVEWFSKVNGEMLSQLVDGIKVVPKMLKSVKNPDTLRIVLDRIGENISSEDKDHILSLIQTEDIKISKYHPLVYFLSNLIKIYDQQKQYDNAIKSFTKVCNEYLGDKSVVYNESRVSISVIRKKNGKPISLDKLSSGEKQMISLFSKLYLDTSNKAALLFDEPELSLSIEWQKQLLPHIVNSNKCSFMIVMTHSPFIFENALDSCASDLSLCIKER